MVVWFRIELNAVRSQVLLQNFEMRKSLNWCSVYVHQCDWSVQLFLNATDSTAG